ncbi:hypothetical protein, partial [Pseudomonas aeruginosa]|uniref:hypothetical protein n=1 Tax=Pseudomonas aeruginosa TaxID=287 RepID=UPI0031B73069
LKLVQESGLIVTTRDNLSGWIQRIATDMQQLRQSGMSVISGDVGVSGTLTGPPCCFRVLFLIYATKYCSVEYELWPDFC